MSVEYVASFDYLHSGRPASLFLSWDLYFHIPDGDILLRPELLDPIVIFASIHFLCAAWARVSNVITRIGGNVKFTANRFAIIIRRIQCH